MVCIHFRKISLVFVECVIYTHLHQHGFEVVFTVEIKFRHINGIRQVFLLVCLGHSLLPVVAGEFGKGGSLHWHKQGHGIVLTTIE